MPVHHAPPPTTRFAASPSDTVSDTVLQPPHLTPLLLAVANDDVADSAIRVTAALAKRRGAVPTVLEVIDPSPYAPPPMLPTMMRMAETLIGPRASEDRRYELSTRVERASGERMPWPTVSRLGGPTACIADEAHQRHSEFLVLGLHHHGPVEHLLGAETTIHVLANAGIPVLGVTNALNGLPRRVLVGVDFSRASVRVAHLAARLIEPPGELVLVHVESPAPTAVPEDLEGSEAIEDEGIRALLERVKSDLSVPAGVFVKTVRLTGDPAEALIEYARYMKPDLIAVASQQHSRTWRLLLGSVARRIVRDGRWSVLVTPPG